MHVVTWAQSAQISDKAQLELGTWVKNSPRNATMDQTNIIVVVKVKIVVVVVILALYGCKTTRRKYKGNI